MVDLPPVRLGPDELKLIEKTILKLLRQEPKGLQLDKVEIKAEGGSYGGGRMIYGVTLDELIDSAHLLDPQLGRVSLSGNASYNCPTASRSGWHESQVRSISLEARRDGSSLLHLSGLQEDTLWLSAAEAQLSELMRRYRRYPYLEKAAIGLGAVALISIVVLGISHHVGLSLKDTLSTVAFTLGLTTWSWIFFVLFSPHSRIALVQSALAPAWYQNVLWDLLVGLVVAGVATVVTWVFS